MRTDESLARPSFRFSAEWRRDALSGVEVPAIDRRLQGGRLENGRFVAHSLSGHERNHFFISSGGEQFSDLSFVSGLDNPADSRGFVVLDYDHDGFQDVALVNANKPLVNLYHNEIGRLHGSERGRFIALRFVGGSRSTTTSSFACRDGYGARVTVALGALVLEREHRCGEGYGTQNTHTMIVGIGERLSADEVAVRWPSGNVQAIRNVPAGTLLTAYEDPAEAPAAHEFESRAYRARPVDGPSVTVSGTEPAAGEMRGRFRIEGDRAPAKSTRLRVYVTMATWCVACKRSLPQLRLLAKDAAGESTNGVVELIGLPVDPDDGEEKLVAYLERWKPPYRLLRKLAPQERSALGKVFTAATGGEALPSTIVTDADGNVVHAQAGVPTVSLLHKLLER